MALRDREQNPADPVVEVGVEVDGVGNLDDVVLYRKMSRSFWQVKYAVDATVLVNTEYMLAAGRAGAPSLLAKIASAWRGLAQAETASDLALVTNRVIDPRDPLVSGCDARTSLLVPAAQRGTARSKLGQARSRWAVAAGLTEEELLRLLAALRFDCGFSPERLRDIVAAEMAGLGLPNCEEALEAGANWIAQQVRDGRRTLGLHEIDRAAAELWPDPSLARGAKVMNRGRWRDSADGDSGRLRSPVGKPIAEWTPSELGLHQTLGGVWRVPYVSRDHDRRVRAAFENALRDVHKRLVLIQGDSCSGKTRTLMEMTYMLAPERALVRPAGPHQLKAWLEAGIPEHSIVWLDEFLSFFQSSESPYIVELLRAALVDDSDVVYVGTIWTTARNELRDGRSTAEVPEEARGIIGALLKSAVIEEVPSTFSAGELRQARDLMGSEFEALLTAAAESGELTQNLAGGPQLVELFETARRSVSIVLTTAMDLVKVGYTDPIPAEMLKHAAYAQLTRREQLLCREDWFEQTIEEAVRPVKKAVSALVPARSSPSSASCDAFVLADYLRQYAKRCRQTVTIDPAVWKAVEEYATAPHLLEAAARHVRFFGDPPAAQRLFRRAATLGSPTAWAALAGFAARNRDASILPELIAVAESDPGAPHGRPGYLWFDISILYYALGRPERAREALGRAGEGFIRWRDLVSACERNGFPHDADDAARRDYEDTGTTDCWYEQLIPRRMRAGDVVGAERAADAMAAEGDPFGWVEIGNQFGNAGDDARAEQSYRRAAELGNTSSWIDIGQILMARGDLAAAHEALWYAAHAEGVSEPIYAWAYLAEVREFLGDGPGAEEAAENANGMGWTILAQLREERGEVTEAEAAADKAAERRDGDGWATIAIRREKRGDRVGAEAAARRAAPCDKHGRFWDDGWLQLIRHRSEQGDWESALSASREYRKGDKTGWHDAVHAVICERAGYSDEAEEVAKRAAATGRLEPWRKLAELRAEQGDETLSVRLARYGVNTDGSVRDGSPSGSNRSL